MPQNGEINTRFAVYKNLCCGIELVIRENTKFPDCKNHRNLTTIWKPLKTEVTYLRPIRKGKSA